MKLAATLLAAAAGGGGGDCLKQAAPGAATLQKSRAAVLYFGHEIAWAELVLPDARRLRAVCFIGGRARGLSYVRSVKAPPGAPDPPEDDAAAGLGVAVA